MDGKSLLILTDHQAAVASVDIEAIFSQWRNEGGEAETRTLEEAMGEEPAFDRIGLIWCILSQRDAPDVWRLIGQAQEHRTPMLLTRPGDDRPAGAEFQHGVVLAPASTPTDALLVMLRTMWTQAAVLSEIGSELRLMQAHQNGLCQQVTKFDEELRFAAQLQREFLPSKLPSVHGLECRALWRPAAYVSGDLYDVIRLDEDHVGVFLADAVGHGVPAALLTVFIRRSLPTKEIFDGGYRIVPPAEALEHLNHEMVESQSDGKARIATAVYAVINCATRHVQLARAGHPQPLLLRQNGDSDWLEPDGGLLGVFDEGDFETLEFQMDEGDRLLLYTDGFELAFPEKIDAGRPKANSKYEDVFHDVVHGSLDSVLPNLASRVDQHAGSLHQSDDLTALLVHAAPTSEPAENSVATTTTWTE